MAQFREAVNYAIDNLGHRSAAENIAWALDFVKTGASIAQFREAVEYADDNLGHRSAAEDEAWALEFVKRGVSISQLKEVCNEDRRWIMEKCKREAPHSVSGKDIISESPSRRITCPVCL